MWVEELFQSYKMSDLSRALCRNWHGDEAKWQLSKRNICNWDSAFRNLTQMCVHFGVGSHSETQHLDTLPSRGFKKEVRPHTFAFWLREQPKMMHLCSISATSFCVAPMQFGLTVNSKNRFKYYFPTGSSLCVFKYSKTTSCFCLSWVSKGIR